MSANDYPCHSYNILYYWTVLECVVTQSFALKGRLFAQNMLSLGIIGICAHSGALCHQVCCLWISDFSRKLEEAQSIDHMV